MVLSKRAPKIHEEKKLILSENGEMIHGFKDF
jgi:hypothetical protein